MKSNLKIILLAIFSLYKFSVIAQETPKAEKIKEYSLMLTNISPVNLSIKYKRQIKNKTYFKLGVIDISGSSNTNYPTLSSSYANHNSTFSLGMELGLEFRKQITDKFAFFHGPNVSFTYQTQITKTDNPVLTESQRKSTSKIYNSGIAYTLGLLFKLNDHFLLSVEINPGIFDNYRTFNNGQFPQYNSKSDGGNFSFSNKFGILSIAYRI